MINLHGYCWDCTALTEILKEFIGGQFQVIKRVKDDNAHLRGEISGIKVFSGIKEVAILFKWLCEERLIHNWKLEAKLKWFPMDHPFGDPCLKIPFDAFRSHPDEDRVKMWGGGFSEVCRFYKRDDFANLVRVGDDFVPRHEKYELALKLITIVLLNQK